MKDCVKVSCSHHNLIRVSNCLCYGERAEKKCNIFAEATEPPTSSGQRELACSATLAKDIADMERGLNALYLEAPASVMDDIMGRWKGILSHLRD